MKPLKTLSLVALAALLAMAFVGASSAMGSAEGTVLCKTEENPCSQANAVTSIHETTLAGSPATLLNGIGNVTCDVLFLSTYVGTAGDSTAETIEGNFSYTNCVMGKTACTVTEKNGPALITVLREEAEKGSVIGKGEVTVKCGSFINCTYNGEGLAGIARGPLVSSETNGSVEIANQQTTKVSGFLCPATAELDITTTPLAATYISSTLGYCVRTHHENNGLYKDSECKEKGKEHEFKYTLLFGPKGWKVGELLCYHTLSGKGLYKVFNSTGECSGDDEKQLSLNENGTILVVE